MSQEPVKITVSTLVQAPVGTVWHSWTSPEHITRWNAASDDWHCPEASNDLRVGGRLTSRMEARDGSIGFDFTGTYTAVEPHARLAFVLGDDTEAREVEVLFKQVGDGTEVIETFEAENIHPVEMQRAGWQSILDRFKAHVEAPAA